MVADRYKEVEKTVTVLQKEEEVGAFVDNLLHAISPFLSLFNACDMLSIISLLR